MSKWSLLLVNIYFLLENTAAKLTCTKKYGSFIKLPVEPFYCLKILILHVKYWSIKWKPFFRYTLSSKVPEMSPYLFYFFLDIPLALGPIYIVWFFQNCHNYRVTNLLVRFCLLFIALHWLWFALILVCIDFGLILVWFFSRHWHGSSH